MSRLAEFRALEQQLAAQLAELETLKNDGKRPANTPSESQY